MHILILLAALAAAGVGERTEFIRRVALNGAAATRTITFDNSSHAYDKAVLEVWRTRAAGTDLTATCKGTVNPTATPESVMGVCSYDASGVCTFSAGTLKSNTSTSEKLAWEVSLTGWAKVTCVFASTSAGASDLLTVTGRLVAQ